MPFIEKEHPMPNTPTATAQPDSPARISKLARLIILLQSPEGASMAAMTAATDWQPHSVRGAMAGAVRRKGHAVTSEKVGDERRWRISGAAR